jgi:hypothetical protein
MSPKEFTKKMKEIAKKYEGDEEAVHAKMDELMCDTLTKLGYGDGVDIFIETDKWYA